ncbi:MAG: hypothetical protein Kow0058_02580 [Roseovarius sp.]
MGLEAAKALGGFERCGSGPVAVRRRAISASRLRFTFRRTCRITAFIDSMMLVLANERRSSGASPGRIRVMAAVRQQVFGGRQAVQQSGVPPVL